MGEDEDAFIDALRDAIQRTIHEHQDNESSRGILLGYVLVAEHLGDDGATWVSTTSGTEHTARTMGLLDYARAQCYARVLEDD